MILIDLLKKICPFSPQVMFNAVLENACSEQGARMSAMDSSSRNAGEMLDRLTLTYNRSLSLSQTLTHTQNKIALTWDKVIKHECVINDVVIHNGTHQLNYFLSSLATLVS